MCGDSITIRLKFDGAVVSGVSFEHEGCVISRAAASLFTERIKGKTKTEVQNFCPDDIFALLQAPITLGRVKCALLPLETIKKIV